MSVQELFRDSFSNYKQSYIPSLDQAKTARAIINCRSSAMGGRTYECGSCGHTQISYNSCRNRHCTQCQGVNKEIWVDKRKQDILNAPYFHVVFTMPEQLHTIIYHNQRLLYDLMYKAVSETLVELSRDPKYLGAQIGFFSVLHTWGQNLHYHPHIHTVVLAGGLTDHGEWREASKKFFIPVKVLSRKFRGKYLHYLKLYYRQGLLKFYKDAKIYRNQEVFKDLLNKCYSLDWYSYTKRTFDGPLAVMKYLGRYTHRIAISNNRIISIGKETITFGVKDYKNNNKKKTVTLKKVEFIRRFLMHVLPKGFVKIRHYGLLANRNKKTRLKLCRKITKSPLYKPKFDGLSILEIVSIILQRDVSQCPGCRKSSLQLAVAGGIP
ncbi:IS91 family transposase [Cytobacillus firmus]|nr:IS91 family transposase [Cytobacillus firmus]MBG9654899.1 transposase [Cytobacillus firmus]MED1907120.1 IS91 family transposase [Cytobacillus firmus]